MSTVLAEAQILADRIGSVCRPDKIILFGSLARGSSTIHDIDLLVVKKSEKKRPFRTKEIFEAIRGMKRTYPLDTLVYTPYELKERLLLGDFFIKNILEEGKTLYG